MFSLLVSWYLQFSFSPSILNYLFMFFFCYHPFTTYPHHTLERDSLFPIFLRSPDDNLITFLINPHSFPFSHTILKILLFLFFSSHVILSHFCFHHTTFSKNIIRDSLFFISYRIYSPDQLFCIYLLPVDQLGHNP
jgi:hypothetical protein